jgi:leucyl-tRNA synthetase
MIFKNWPSSPEEYQPVLLKYSQLLSPFAPHLAEELWNLYGGSETITTYLA